MDAQRFLSGTLTQREHSTPRGGFVPELANAHQSTMTFTSGR